LKSLRTRFVNNDTAPAWATNIPYDIREDGMRDFKKAWKNASQKVKASTAQAQCDGHVRRAPQTYERRG
jgi:hypothetical protein